MNTHHLTTAVKIVSLSLLAFLFACSGEEDIAATVASHLERSKAYEKQGQYRAAIIEAKNIIKKDRGNAIGYEQLANIFYTLGSHKGVVSTLDASPQTLSSNSQLLKANAYARLGKFSSAESLLNDYKKSATGASIDVQLLEAKILAGKAQTEEALRKLNSIIASAGKHAEAENLVTNLYIKENNLAKASENLASTLAHSPKNPEALYLSAMMAYNQNNLETAEEQLTNALIELPETDIILPLRSATLSQLSKVLTEQGRTSEALIYSKLLAEANPDSAEASSKLQRALSLLQQGKFEEAELHLSDLNKDYPSNEATSIYLGLINFRKGDFIQAEQLFSESYDPEVANTELTKAIVATKIRLQKTNEALDILEKAIELHPDNLELQKTYGLTAINSDTRKDKGVVTLEKIIATEPDNISVHLTLIKHYLSNNKEEIGLAKLENLRKLYPDDIEVISIYSQAQFKLNNSSAAEQAVKQLLSARNRDAQALILASRYALLTQNTDKAIKSLNETLNKAPDNSDALTLLGGLELKAKNAQRAKQLFQSLIEASPASPIGYKGLVSAYELEGEKDKAIAKLQHYQKYYQQQTNTPLFVLAEFYLLKNDLENTSSTLEQLSSETLDSDYYRKVVSGFNHKLYQQAAAKKEFQTARSHLMKVIELTPNNEQLTGELIVIETELNNNVEAKRLIDVAKAQYPNSSMPIMAEANMLVKTNQTEAAIKLLSNAWPQKKDPRLAYSLAKLNEANPQQRSLWLEEWMKVDSNNPTPHIMAAGDAQKIGQNSTAIKHYEKAIGIQANNPIALNNLAWLYFEAGNPLALETAEKAAKIAPNSPEVLDTYGWVEFKQGNKTKALVALKKAAELAPNNKEIQEHLNIAQKSN